MSRHLAPTLAILALTACIGTPEMMHTQDSLVEVETKEEQSQTTPGDATSTLEASNDNLTASSSSSSTSSYGDEIDAVIVTNSELQASNREQGPPSVTQEPNVGPTSAPLEIAPAPEPELYMDELEESLATDDMDYEGDLSVAYEAAPAPSSIGTRGSSSSRGRGGSLLQGLLGGASGAAEAPAAQSVAPVRTERARRVDSGNSYGSNYIPHHDKPNVIGGGGLLPTQQQATSNTEGYTNYGVNDMTSTRADRFSTFSIDVDTGSYTIARRKLNEGQLPPAASVRVEEFINFLPYDYEEPTGAAPFAVHMEAAPNPFQRGHHVLRVGVQAQEIDQSERGPIHLTFLVDVSGSMSTPDKLGLAQRSLRHLVDQLRPGDTVALATYAGRVAAILDPTDVRERRTIHRAIQGLQAGGSTAMNSGIQLAYKMARSAYEPGCENRVIVLSDGDANVGPSSHQEILNTIRGYAQQGITLSTVGFGMGNYQDTMMEQLANQGDGNYSYIDTFQEAQRVFGEDLAGTLQVVARDVKLQVEFNPAAVHSYRLIGYENRDIADRDFRNDSVDAGEVGSGHRVTALYDVILANEGVEELATVRVRNKAPGPDSPAVEWFTTFDGDHLVESFNRASRETRMAFSAATFAEMLRGSPYAAEVSWEELIGLTRSSQRRGVSADDELIALQQRAASLSGARGATALK